jgi:hypothetical protein
MKIIVTEEDIEGGQKGQPHSCALARAFLRAGVDHFGVLGQTVMVADAAGHLATVPLPPAVRDWILSFDAGKVVSPFSFDIGLRRDARTTFNSEPKRLPVIGHLSSMSRVPILSNAVRQPLGTSCPSNSNRIAKTRKGLPLSSPEQFSTTTNGRQGAGH